MTRSRYVNNVIHFTIYDSSVACSAPVALSMSFHSSGCAPQHPHSFQGVHYSTHPAICAGAREVIYRDPLSFKHKPQLHLTTPCPDRRLLLKRKIFGNGWQNMPRYSLGGDDREISIWMWCGPVSLVGGFNYRPFYGRPFQHNSWIWASAIPKAGGRGAPLCVTRSSSYDVLARRSVVWEKC